MAKACVVTGAAGFIGSHLVDRLLADNWLVVGVDDLSTGSMDNLVNALKYPAFYFVGRSVTEPELLDDLKTEYPELDTIFHLAAISSVQTSILSSSRTMLVNYVSTVTLLSKAEKLGFTSFVFAGSAAEYGNSDSQEKLVESAAHSDIQWPSPYALSKYLATAAVAASSIGVSLRFFNVYGPRQRGTEDGGVIAIFTNKIAKGEPLTIYGDGKQTRDFLYVSDAVEAYTSAVNLRGIYNVARGIGISLLDVIAIFNNALGESVEVVFEPEMQGDIKHSCADISSFVSATGWTPQVTLTDGITRMICTNQL
jgi:UDP-glucose 4-epimerase